MDDKLYAAIHRRQYQAFFAMFRQCLQACPDGAWDARGDEPPFWQQAYHTLFYTDFYLSDTLAAFARPAFAAERWEDLGAAVQGALTRPQLLAYLDTVAAKSEALLGRLAGGGLDGQNPFHWTGPTVADRIAYNLRHAQHHLGWMDSYVHRQGGEPMRWICFSD